MQKKVLFLLLSFFIIAFLPGSAESQSNESNSRKQLQLFVGAGNFKPALDQWNNGIEELHASLTTTSYTSNASSPALMESGNYIDFGLEYFFTENFSAALSIGHLKYDVSNSYTGTYNQDGGRPLCTIINEEQMKFSHEIRMNPALLTLSYTLQPLKNYSMFSVYGGGGVGYYFTSLKNELFMDMDDTYLYKQSTIDTVVSLDLLANLKANVNPLGYHLKAGFNFNYGIFHLNLEAGYHFAKAEIKEEDDKWTYFTRKYQYLLDDTVNYKCFETTLFQIEEEQFDKLKLDELDLSGLMLKANFGFSF